jgi:hypothetical protein
MKAFLIGYLTMGDIWKTSLVYAYSYMEACDKITKSDEWAEGFVNQTIE